MPKTSEQLKQEYIDSLDSFIAQNPKVGQLDTSKFRDFLIGLVGHESSYNPTARQGSYFGWYQTNKQDADPYKQHMNAFNHLNSLFRETITKDDVIKARELGINDSALMLKYWNQGNRVNNYIWNNKDSADGLGTKISNYGNDLTTPLDVYNYAMDNLYGDYVVKKGDSWSNIQKRVRLPGRDYVTAGRDLWDMQHLGGRPFGSLSIGQSFNFGEQQIQKRETYGRIIDPELSARTKTLLELSNRINYNQGTEYLTNYKKGGLLKRDYGGLIYTAPYDNSNTVQYDDNSVYKSSNDIDEVFNLLRNAYSSRFPVEEPYIYKIQKNPETKEQPSEEITPVIEKGVIQFNKGIDVGNMQELINLMRDEGISFRITSGNRPGALTSKGLPSHHGTGNALDITPIEGQTWDDLINQMKRSKRFIAYMKEHKLGILDERSKKMQAKTGATGAHFHIGPDVAALSNFNLMFG